MRDEARRAVDDVAVVDEKAGVLEAPPEPAADEPVDARTVDRDAEQQQPQQHRELVRVAEPTQVGRQLAATGEELVARAEPFLDPRRGVSGLSQEPRQLERGACALRLGRAGPAGRRDAPEGLHGASRPALERLVRLQVVPEVRSGDPSDPSVFCGLYSTSIFANARRHLSVGTRELLACRPTGTS